MHQIAPFGRVIVALLTILVTTGCPSPKESPKNPQTVDKDWDVNSTSISCGGNTCPNALGALFTIKSKTEYKYGLNYTTLTVFRCTAALYEAQKIITAGHCASEVRSGNRSYFRTVATPGRPSRTFKVARIIKSEFEDERVLSPDYASLELETPANAYDFVRPPLESWPTGLKDLTAMVINQPVASDSRSYSLDAVECDYDDSEDFYPHISNYPTLFATKNCRLIGGNSGGPVFARDDRSRVLGILSRSSEAGKEKSSSTTDDANNGLNIKNFSTFTNAICIDLPGWSVPRVQCQDISLQSVADRLIEKRSSKLSNWLQNEMIRWSETHPNRVQIGGGSVVMAPVPIFWTKTFDVGSSQRGVTLIPMPICVDNAESGSADWTFGSSGHVLTEGFGFKAEPSDDLTIRGTVALKLTSKTKLEYRYRIGHSNYPWAIVPTIKEILEKSSTNDLAPCTGRDLENHTEYVVKKFLNANNK